MRIPVMLGMLFLVGCTGPAFDEGEPTPAESAAAGSGTPRHTLHAASEQPIRDDTITGVLGADSVEGGCAYLESADGTRYEVIYPRGWRVTVSPLEVTDPDGHVVARGGDELTVRGAKTTEVASICQIGPIFQATSVET